MLSSAHQAVSLLPSDIAYIESSNRMRVIHLSDGESVRIGAALGEIFSLLPEGRFAYCHRSVIVNLEMVRSVTTEGVTLRDGTPVDTSRRRIPELPIFCDPSHIGGRRTLIQPLAQQAIDLQFDGLMIECHITPETAKSDAAQQITPAELDRILSCLTLHTDTPAGDEILHDLRRQIDALDTTLLELLSKRMEITNEIGIYKKQHNMPVLQTGRYNEIISRLVSRCAGTGLDPDFIKKIFEIIHSQSVANQLKL